MKTYQLYCDVLLGISNLESELDYIEIEVFGHQNYELVGEQLHLSDLITVHAEAASEAINKAYQIVNEQYSSTSHIGFYHIGIDGEGNHGYLNVQYQACHIHFADETDEEFEGMLEELNTVYYNLIA